MPTEKKPITNCHTHIFTAEHVPPWLAKTFLPWPLYFLLPVPGIVALFRWWYNGPGRWPFRSWYKNLVANGYFLGRFIVRRKLLNTIRVALGVFLTVQVFFIVYDWLSKMASSSSSGAIKTGRQWLIAHHLLYPQLGWFWKLLLFLLLTVCFASGRNFLIFVFKSLFKFLKFLPGKQTSDLARRYINLGRFAFHGQQQVTFRQLKNQYPEGTRFVILPMDMEYMEAGKVKTGYRQQMEDLAAIKQKCGDSFLPFVFVDPRRIAAEPDYFVYEEVDGRIVLGECLIKKYIVDLGFSGFKIYPALGYYPFDELLLPVWRYAAENHIPILTHCIRGTIFYRGPKKPAWDRHPVFKQANGDSEYVPLLLPETKNREFINNFTHPLNYLCLLDRSLLAQLVKTAKDDRIRQVFGYDAATGQLASGLEALTLCFGHFGGDDEWRRYFELDRDLFSKEIVTLPQKGIDFLHGSDGQPSPGKPELIWKYVDWYSIICSMMLQYPNVYSDISYILHNPAILPLLKRTLMPGSRLRERVLYGTDFYVVRNYKSDKNMLADMLAGLTTEEFDLLARDNPCSFLARS
jgi:predicted TIM-barrel fold metal-dependent hydrolase